MKANEAPEKLYIDFRDRAESTWRCAYTEKALANDIEYTRTDVLTDAFIEKALQFFKKKFDVEDYYYDRTIDGYHVFAYTKLISDFKEYLQNESKMSKKP